MTSSALLVNILRLHTIPGIGSRSLRRILVWADGDADQLSTVFDLDTPSLTRQFGIKAETAVRLISSSADEGLVLSDALAYAHINPILEDDPLYPAGLRALDDAAPAIMYAQGNLSLLNTRGVAFSGARNASVNGIEYTTSLAKQAAERQLTVISGGAPGVDTAAHSAALTNAGTTSFVLPEGLLRYNLRAELRTLIEAVPDRAVILSEFPPRMTWSAQNAMIRNGTILALANMLIVIEAGSEGGTLDAGRRALKRGLPCWVLRYAEPPPSAAGNPVLLAEGAFPLAIEPSVMLPNLDQPPPTPPDSSTQLSLF